MTLEPGDLIPTGTPAGVGPVQPGDRIEVEIDGLGILENTSPPSLTIKNSTQIHIGTDLNQH